MVDTLVKILVATVFLMTLVEFYAIFMKYQNVSYVARRLTRAVEVSGTVEGIDADFNNLCSMSKLDGAAYNIEATYFNSSGAIQLRDTFTVEVTYTYYLNIFSPSFGAPVKLPINMRAKAGGMSEVFYKSS